LGSDWQASFGYYRVGGLSALGESTPVEAHQRLDLRLAKDFKVEGTRGEVAAVLQNILGNYNDFRNDNVFDRRAYLSLRLDY
jgi:iron complex outermembrane receptor protein